MIGDKVVRTRSNQRGSVFVCGDSDMWQSRRALRNQCRAAVCRIAAQITAFFLLALLFGAPARAHNVDTSYARVRIFADHLEVRLTCDIFTLQRIVPDLDANRDGGLSRAELRRATPAIQKFFRERVKIEINEAASDLGEAKDPFWPLDAPDPIPAAAWHTNEALVSFGFDKPLAISVKSVALLFETFRVFGDRHSVLGVFEYRGQSTEVVFTVAEPDYLFDVAFAASGIPAPKAAPAPAPKNEIGNDTGSAKPAAPHRSNADDSPVWSHFKMGIEHILTGFDHMCFLLALLVVSRLRPIIAIVTSFTIAHSITLILAVLQIVTLPKALIECSIAVTIIYVALENIWRKEYAHRWVLTFFFGLIHGFGFANAINPQELPPETKAKSLFVLNLGIEAGQLAVVLVLLPITVVLAKWKYGPRAKVAISITVALLGFAWFLDRAFNLGLMPF